MKRSEGLFRVVDCPMKWEDYQRYGYELNISPSTLGDSLFVLLRRLGVVNKKGVVERWRIVSLFYG